MDEGGSQRQTDEKQRRMLGWEGDGRETDEKEKKMVGVQRDRKGEEKARKQGGQKNKREKCRVKRWIEEWKE